MITKVLNHNINDFFTIFGGAEKIQTPQGEKFDYPQYVVVTDSTDKNKFLVLNAPIKGRVQNDTYISSKELVNKLIQRIKDKKSINMQYWTFFTATELDKFLEKTAIQ